MKFIKRFLLTIIEAVALIAAVCLAILLFCLLGHGLAYVGIIEESPFSRFGISDLAQIFQKN